MRRYLGWIYLTLLVACSDPTTPCDPGLQDRDGDGVCMPACGVDVCGGHGTCDDATGAIACACEAGYREMDGTCAPASCATTGLSCGPHQACRDTADAPVCECVRGYRPEAGACVWSGVVADPDLNGTPGAWTVKNGVAITGGAATFDQAASCNGGHLSQTIELPPASFAEPLAVEVTASVSIDRALDDYRPGAAIRLGDRVTFLDRLTKTSTTVRACLGDAAFGGPTRIDVSQGNGILCPYATLGMTIERIDIVPDSTCPPLGAIVNGDFAQASTGWTLSAAQANNEPTTAEVAPSTALGSGPAAHLFVGKPCAELHATTSVAIPSGPTALVFDAQLTPGRSADITVDQHRLVTLEGSGSPATFRVCIPAGVGGWARTLAWNAYVGGGCGTDDPTELWLDNVAVVSDPSCGAAIADPGFEQAPGGALRAWWISPRFERTTDPQRVHDGLAAAYAQGARCEGGDIYADVSVPLATATGGPALRFWMDNTTTASELVFEQGDPTVLPVSAGWEQHVVCLPPYRAGGRVSVDLYASFGDGTACGDPSAEHLAVDDFEVITDPSCPH